MLQPVPGSSRTCLLMGTVLLVLVVVSATVGREHNLLPQTGTLLVRGADSVSMWLFWQLWLPRTLLAVGVGASLAVAGSVFQLLSGNPLGSPDIIGINAGAAAGAVSVGLFWSNSLPMGAGALLGAVLTLVLILAANGRKLYLGINTVIGGLAVNAVAAAWVQFVLTGMRQEDAYLMSVWLSGSLAQKTWRETAVIWAVLPVCMIVLGILKRPLAVMKLGNEHAANLGITLHRINALALVPATVLACASVVCAGPVAFVALAVPHMNRKILKSSRLDVVPNALMGAVVLLAADLPSRFLPASLVLPVGVFTAGLGGLYLLYLISNEKRKGLC